MVIPSSILESYNLHQADCIIEPLSTGLINTTWKIIKGEQWFILQRVNNKIFKNPYEIAENISRLEQYLTRHNPEYLFVAPLRDIHNQTLVYDSIQGYFRLFPFIRGSHTISVVATPDQAYEAAFQFGKFTNLLSNFDTKSLHLTIPDFHNLTLRYQQFEDVLKKGNPIRIKQSAELIAEIKIHHSILWDYERIKRNQNVPLRVTHNDTKISNVLFDERNKAICIIDLDTVMPGYFISDLGDMMRTYLSPANEEEKDFSKINVREDFFRAIVQGYLASIGSNLTQEESRLIFYSGLFLIYMQAIRFLTDYCNNDSYYGARYEEQNLVRAGNQLYLLKRLLERRDDFERIIPD